VPPFGAAFLLRVAGYLPFTLNLSFFMPPIQQMAMPFQGTAICMITIYSFLIN